MESDIERWDRRYRNPDPARTFVPDDLLVTHCHALEPGVRALDVACGTGHNTIALAERGAVAFGIDASVAGLAIAHAEARRRALPVFLLAADLDRYPLPVAYFDLVAVFRYLNRALFPGLVRTLAPGGLLVYRTFNQRFLATRPGFNPDYVLRPGELLAAFAGLEVVATNDDQPGADRSTHLVARRRGGR